MAICYELEDLQLKPSQKHLSSLIRVNRAEAHDSASPVVAIMSKQEFQQLGLEHPNAHESLEDLASSDSNYVDIYPDYIVGSFSVPSKNSLTAPPALFAFYMDKQRLIFVDEGETARRVLEHVIDIGVLSDTTTAHCLYVFFKALLVDDLTFLGDFEDRMESIEEKILNSSSAVRSNAIMEYRRQTMRFCVYYQEVGTMANVLSDNENKLMTDAEGNAFDHIERLADRLSSRSETLKEYSLQLHELQQTRIDLKQNSTMQIFTIVTVLFAPLTLITGWFGMNLNVLPGLDWPYLWVVLVVGALVCTTALLAFFHWKKWL